MLIQIPDTLFVIRYDQIQFVEVRGNAIYIYAIDKVDEVGEFEYDTDADAKAVFLKLVEEWKRQLNA